MGELLGSPAYMAPEQVRGEASSPATDVYALGVVLYEMVTGELPFLGESAFSTALKRLQEPPPSPRRLVPDLDPAWERVILRCLERKPEDRFPRAGEAARALEPGTAPVRGPARWIAAAALALSLVIASVALFKEKPSSAPVARPAVAVLGFDNLSRDQRVDYVGTALFQMLPTELGSAESLRLVAVEDIDRARLDLDLKGSASLSVKTLQRLRARLGADFVVTGSYLVTAGGSARYDVAVQDTRSGETVASFSESGTEEGVLAALESLGSRLRSRLGAGERPVVRTLPAKLETARLYSEGLSSLHLFEAPRARDLLRQAAAAEPDNPLIHSALAAAWSALGHDEEARLSARRAFELSGSLRPEERQAIEASYRETSHEWEAAIRIYRGLAESFPDNLDYGLRLATAQTTAGRSADAAATLSRLRQLSPLLAQDPRIDLAQAVAAGLRSEYALQRDAARRAAKRGGELQARLLVAEARLEEGRALHKLGEPAGAGEAFSQAQRLFAQAGDRRGVAKALRAQGELEAAQAQIEEARAHYDEALALQREIGDERGAAETVRLLGNLYYDTRDDDRAAAYFGEALAAMTRLRNRRGEADVLHSRARLVTRQGDLAAARGLYERALVLQRETLYRQSEAKSLQGLALLDSMEGHLPSARRHYERALALQRGSGDRSGAATVLNNMAPLVFQLGDYAAARKARQEALATSREIGDRVGVARGLRGLADVERQEGNLDAARKLYDQALAAYREIGSREHEAAVQDEIAVTLLLQGRPREALAMLEGPLAFCREKKARREEAKVLSDRGRTLHALGNLDGARRDLEESLAASREVGDLRTKAEALVGLGLVRGDQGALAEARRLLGEALALYRSRGDPSGEASALSGLGTVLSLQGESEKARSHHQQALAIRKRLGERLGAEESTKALASL